ncbi:adenosylcobinamide-phosphate synthase [Lysinibacillus composti]|uniref:Cobalamin biosynthesis protein CobD n=1 Tax=Lysinibacillus composti TaxID=720633 RepID=A0A3N9UDU1_9BACI|nr:adenosylcobinamide-phosphate synthase CbiB [Lysinibacillus composti]MBM7608837.1 adenosylcobinamide-phosphate synthase [Lysinibacillus composti]RQW74418.1 cobalamin biosynthesis protein CobD [Lysinibacillus composti]
MQILAVILGQLLDLIIGDPPKWPHPIRWIGSFISWLTKKLNKGDHRFYKGLFLAIIVISTVTLTTLAIVYAAYQVHMVVGFIVETILIAIGLAQKSLKEAAMVVYDALKMGDMQEARTKLSWIVGRDTAELEEPEIVRGVVETVSENTSDGITAPLFYAILFGAPGLWAYKAINTLDSMVGYKNEKYRQFGTVSARLDDVANFIPSRITGLLILLFTKNKTNRTLLKRMKLWLNDAKKHPSPNSGYLEAATAYQLGIRLGGYNTYHGVTSFRAYMGEPDEELRSVHIKETIQQMTIVSLIFTIVVGGVNLAISFPWR